ncbi:MAG: tandem-95 repeat protein [Caldilineaceae bacterium]
MSYQPFKQAQPRPRLHPPIRLFTLLLTLFSALVLTLPVHAQGGESITTPDTDGDVGRYTSLVLDSNGFPVVSYHDDTNDDLKVLHCNDVNCAGDDESITSPATNDLGGRYSAIVLDDNGYPVVSYMGSNDGLSLLHCNDANCAGGDESISLVDPNIIAGHTSIVLDGNGYPIISYYAFDQEDLRILHCNDVNCTRDDESITSPDTVGDVGAYTSLALDSNGNPVISYFDDTNDDLKVMHCNDVNCAGGDESITAPDTDGNVGRHTSLMLDSNGYPVVSYGDSGHESLKLLHCNDANCAGNDESITTPDPFGGEWTSLALDANGDPIVSHTYVEDRSLRILHCNDANCAGNDESITIPDAADAVGEYGSLVLDSNGYPVVSYHQAVSIDLKLLHCNDANCANAAPVAVNDAYTTVQETSLIIAAPGVLANDSDPDGDTLTAVLTGDEPRGGVTLNSDGSFTYTPVAGVTGLDAFTYFVTDGAANSNIATVRITVTPACPTFPVTVADGAALNQAIECYNAITTPGSYIINVDADITLSAATMPIDNDGDAALHIYGNGYTIDGANNYRIFTVADSDVTISDVTLQNGLGASLLCLGISVDCGGAMLIDTNAVVTLTLVRAQNNTAIVGGALYNLGTLTIRQSTLSSNSAAIGTGGGVFSNGVLIVDNSTILANTAQFGAGIHSSGALTLVSSTLSANSAVQGGGGLLSDNGTVAIINSTFSDNSATGGGGIYNGDLFSNNGAAIQMHNTIIANSTGGDCVVGAGNISNQSYNLIEDSDKACGIMDGVSSSIIGQDPSLGSLQDNGGPTWTHALIAGSPAVNAGDNALAVDASGNALTTDQRGTGFPRIVGGTVDIGAFESDFIPNNVPVAADDSYNTDADASLTIPAPGVLSNDSDADGDALTAVEVSAPSNGTLTFNSDGSFTYVPNAGFTGVDSFTYLANDGSGDSNVATVIITVNAVSTPFATCGGYDVFETAPGVYIAPSFTGNLIVGTDGDDWLIGTDGPDLILGRQGGDDLWGGAGDDVICGGAGVDIILGMDGNDTLYGDDQPDWIVGGPDDDTIFGGAGNDDLFGNGGNDTIHGEGGNDVLLGGLQNDVLYGGEGADNLYGNLGDDELLGGPADDFCLGGFGSDSIAECEGASAATADDATDVDAEAARHSNDGANGEDAIEQRIQQLFLPLVTQE